jgi:hypothetical protein
VVQCQTNAEVHDVAVRPLLERAAWRRTNKKLPQVEQEVSRRDEERIAQQMSAEIGKLIAQGNESFVEKLRSPLLAAGAWPSARCWSDAQGLQVEVGAPSGKVPAAARPDDWKADADFALCLHESLLNETLGRLFAGREVCDEQILKGVETVTGDSPRALWVHDRSQRWSVTLADKSPLVLAFQGGLLGVTVHLQEAKRGDERLPCEASLSAKFDSHLTPDGLVFTRSGDLQVDVAAENLSPEELDSLRTFLTKKGDAVLAQAVYFDTLQAPAGSTVGLKMRQVKMTLHRFEDGWASFKYQWQPEANGSKKRQAARQPGGNAPRS